MKRIHLAVLCLSSALIFGFSGVNADKGKGSFTIEGKTYKLIFFSHSPHAEKPSTDDSAFGMSGKVSNTVSNEALMFIHIVGKSGPATGEYPLQDFATTGKAGLRIKTPKPDEITYRAQSGQLHVTNNGGTITAKFANIPVKSDNGKLTSVASGELEITL